MASPKEIRKIAAILTKDPDILTINEMDIDKRRKIRAANMAPDENAYLRAMTQSKRHRPPSEYSASPVSKNINKIKEIGMHPNVGAAHPTFTTRDGETLDLMPLYELRITTGPEAPPDGGLVGEWLYSYGAIKAHTTLEEWNDEDSYVNPPDFDFGDYNWWTTRQINQGLFLIQQELNNDDGEWSDWDLEYALEEAILDHIPEEWYI